MLLLIAALVAVAAPASADPLIDSLRVELGGWSGDLDIGFAVSPLQEALSQIEQSLNTAAARTEGKTIDLVLMVHTWANARQGFVQPGVSTPSQDEVYRLLANGHYDVIGSEGHTLERVTLPDFWIWLVAQVTKQYGSADTLVMRQNFNLMLQEDGVLRYLRYHPNIQVTGIEELALNQLHSAVLDALDRRPYEYEALDHLNWQLSRLRSRLAVAKTILRMDKLKVKHGCIVIGLYHESETLNLTDDWHVTGKVFRTVVP